MRRSFDGKKRKEMLKQLEHWNQALRNCGLEKCENIPRTGIRVSKVRDRFDERRTSMIRIEAQALHQAIKKCWTCTCRDAHFGNMRLPWHEEQALRTDTFNVAFANKDISQICHTNLTTSWKSTSVTLERKAIQSGLGIRPSEGTDVNMAPGASKVLCENFHLSGQKKRPRDDSSVDQKAPEKKRRRNFVLTHTAGMWTPSPSELLPD